jgi:transcription antitermination factor NusG
MLEWYILRTAIGEEANVASQLEHGPVQRQYPHQIGGVMVPRDGQGKILYPGYLLVELEWSSSVEEAIRTLPGSVGFDPAPTTSKRSEYSEVGEGIVGPDASTTCGTPAVVPRDEIERIRRRTAHQSPCKPINNRGEPNRLESE